MCICKQQTNIYFFFFCFWIEKNLVRLGKLQLLKDVFNSIQSHVVELVQISNLIEILKRMQCCPLLPGKSTAVNKWRILHIEIPWFLLKSNTLFGKQKSVLPLNAICMGFYSVYSNLITYFEIESMMIIFQFHQNVIFPTQFSSFELLLCNIQCDAAFFLHCVCHLIVWQFSP